MEASFTQWRDSSGYRVEGDSVIISDSDEENDFINDSRKIISRIIDESNDFNVSPEVTPKKNMKFSDDDDDDDTPIVRPVKNCIKKTKNYNIDTDNSDYEQISNYEEDEYHSINNMNNSESDISISYSPTKSKGKKRKDVTHDNTKEDIKELRPNSSSDSLNNVSFLTDNSDGEINTDEIAKKDEAFPEVTAKFDSLINMNLLTDNSDEENNIDEIAKKDEAFPGVTIELDSDSTSGQNSDSEFAKTFAKKEIGVGNIDPLHAQKRALAVFKLEQLKDETAKMKLLLTEGNVEILPDKGQKLQECIRQKEKEMETLTYELENNPLIPLNDRKTETEEKSYLMKKEIPFLKDESDSDYLPSDHSPLERSLSDHSLTDHSDHSSYLGINNIPMRPTTSPELKELGKRAQATMDKELALTVERLQDLHGSLVARPLESEKMEDPRGLKVQLMPHQQHALAWLLWREGQKPSGGVLADDMGLGKTLTMIALIMITLAKEDPDNQSDDNDDDDEKWSSEKKPLRHKGGTLVVCPASLLSQWESEVQSKCKRGLLSIEVHHGSNRQTVPKRLAKNDIVITTYNILAREYKTNSTLYKINWKRVILDEAHIVRNHKSQQSEAVCGLVASKRWALTGTPIQNKELDLYALLKFLRCSPFNDLRVWKRWVDNKNAAGHQRLATVMKTLMLRRTKQELMAKGELESLPDKFIEEVVVQLDRQEQLVYEKILVYSRTLFAQFLAQRAEKEHMFDLHHGKYNRPAYLSNPNKETQFTKAQNKLLAMHADVKTHEILVLLLRLRQVCCHPALIHAMLDQEDVKQSGIMDMENLNPDLLSRMNNISLNGIDEDDAEERNIGIDERITGNLLTAENPVFDDDRISSKMRKLLDTVKEILQKGNDKLIIVSQWAMLLEVIASHLSSIKGATYSKFTGSVAIKDRQNVIESFNRPNSGPRILLLSLTAGGVGLNLVGGNYLLLFDIHWNPQLESQAQDRIYRFGQKKNVYVYKFVCVNTIEERIKALQERKLEIAKNVLTGDKAAVGKLTLNDLKSLFGF